MKKATLNLIIATIAVLVAFTSCKKRESGNENNAPETAITEDCDAVDLEELEYDNGKSFSFDDVSDFSIYGEWNYVKTTSIDENGNETPYSIPEYDFFPPFLDINVDGSMTARFYESLLNGRIVKVDAYRYTFMDVEGSGEGMTWEIYETFSIEYNPETGLLKYSQEDSSVFHYFQKNE